MITDAKQLLQELAQASATQNWYRHWTGLLLYTDGIQHLAEQAESYWLIDAIASYQNGPIIRNNPDLQYFQLWILTVSGQQGQLKCYTDSPDTGELVIDQDIPLTDFPLSEIKLFVENGVLLLPSEH